MRRVAFEIATSEVGGEGRCRARSRLGGKLRRRRATLEALETRTLMSTLPATTYTGNPFALATAGNHDNNSSPQVAIDRYNPKKMVAVWVNNNPTDRPQIPAIVEGAYSIDGGKTWQGLSGLPPILTDPDSSPTAPIPYADTTDPSVGFDAQNQFYILVDEHSSANASGNLLISRFDFTGSTPFVKNYTVNGFFGGTTTQDYNSIYGWANGFDPATTPTMAVDDNQVSFADPTTGAVQTDPTSGNVYVAWATNDTPPPSPITPANFNPNGIVVVTSPDQGQSFTNTVIPNELGAGYQHIGGDRNTAPQLVISQGTPVPAGSNATPTVQGGQVTVVWDDFGTLANASPPQDQIRSATLNPGISQVFTNNTPVPIATAPQNGSITTSDPITVNIANPNFGTLANLTVTVNIQDGSLNQLSGQLIGPNGQVVQLFFEKGNATGFFGISGANMGLSTLGTWIGATFDDRAAQNINEGTAPYIGHYTPERGTLLGPFVGDTAAQLNGTWQLLLTNFNSSAQTPGAAVVNWSINLSSGQNITHEAVVGTTSVRGTYSGAFPLGAPSTPSGIGPEAVIASDNTLGSFSPNEGNLYVAYVYHDNTVNNNPATNTDIALAVSSDGGKTWVTQTTKVNDDDGQTDGFSGAVTLEGTEVNGRSQYMPAIAVDQVTGTLAMSWRDARYDVSNARVATYVTTSIDGGTTFSPDVYANPSQTVRDNIGGAKSLMGPDPDNQSGGAAPDGTFGFGTKMALVAYDGMIMPVWAGNFNFSGSGYNTPALLSIYARPMTTAAGPRIVSSTMGPVGGPNDALNTQVGPDGTPEPTQIEVTFDRPVDPNTFSASDVEVFYKGTTASSSLVSLLVTAVNKVPSSVTAYGATSFIITFDPTKKSDGSSRGTNIDFTGTYSYLIKPDISDRVRSVVLPQVTQPVINAQSGTINVPVSAGASPVTSTLTVSGFPAAQTISSMTVTVNMTYPRDGDLELDLIAPNGTSIVLYRNSGDNGHDFFQTTFDDSAGQSILTGTAPYTGSFVPQQLLNNLAGQSVDGTYTLKIIDNGSNSGVLNSWSIRIKSLGASSAPIVSNGNLMDQNANGTVSEDATVTPYTGLTPGDDYVVPTPAPTVALGFNLNPNGTTPFPNSPYNQDTLPLIVSGPQIASTSVPSPGAQGTADNLVLNNTASSIDVTFDRDMNPSTVTPASVLRIMGPAGLITGPQTYSLGTSAQNEPIPDGTGAVLLSSIAIPTDNGTFPINHLAVQLNVTHARDSDLTAYLIAPNGSKVQLFSGVGGNGQNFINTVLDDSAINALTAATAPFTGSFRPQNSLQAFAQPGGVPMDLAPSKTQNTWTLELVDSKSGSSGVLNSWSLIATPQISITPNPNGTDPNPAAPRTYRINFPQQSLSGTYTVQLGSSIASASGDKLDANQNAGLEVLRGGGTDVATTPVTYSGPGLPQPIPAATKNNTGTTIPGQLISTINVTDSFPVQGVTAAGLAGVVVQANITQTNDPDLVASLVYDLGLPSQVTIPLFTNVGNVGVNHSNFQNTIFTDLSPTPIQNGQAPFFGAGGFRPQGPLLSPSIYGPGLVGLNSAGTWSLVIQNVNPQGSVGTLSNWSITFQKPLPSSGLGEPVADQEGTTFRIFTMDPTNPLASSTWTAVGPASIGQSGSGPESSPGGASGRIGGIAVDPSDPSGNTVYVGGASGGIWKTTNFLDPGGPTWIPLTDFGPTQAINIGAIAIYPRNNDPRQSIIIGATGEGDTGSSGVGFLISKDGGATWNLYDSTVNVDANGNLLPISSPNRDHTFVGDSAFKVIIDPKPTTNGNIIIYAALSGPTGGIWRSEDSGQSWQNMKSGQATDVVFDLSSGLGGPNGNLQVLYGAIRGQGVFMSPNQGQLWNPMNGTTGNPFLVDPGTGKNINPSSTPNPNGGGGRIELATPYLTGKPVQDDIYQGWLYAVVINADGSMNAVYLTKDFGQNWTHVRIPTLPPIKQGGGTFDQAVPSNDVGLNDFDIGGGPPGTGLPKQGNYDVSLAIDPTNPNIIYLGGTADGQSTGFLRIDTTTIWDAHALVPYDNNGILGGSPITKVSTGPAVLVDQSKAAPFPAAPYAANGTTNINGSLNVIGFPNGYIGAQTFANTGSLTNNGAGVKWIPFDIGGTDQHRIVTMVDPLTGHARLIIGDDQGVFTAVDNNGTFDTGIGTAVAATGSRNGNLQITQFYYGATQPSNVAAQIAGALFYGSAQDNGGPQSDPNVLNDGNITWGGPGGDAAGVATDQTGTTGTLYQYWWPCCGGQDIEFFQVNGQGKTSGLLQQSNGLPTPDPQWPSTGGSNFAVNPINPNQVMMSSQAGRVFRTENALAAGAQWFVIGDPGAFDGTYAPAVAFGAPDPGAPGGIGNLDNFLYVGTSGGHIYVSQTGGGQWFNISQGLTGSIQEIITDPTRGNHDAYAVTSNGVFYIPDSIALAKNPTNTADFWQNVSGNLFSLMNNPFGTNGVQEPLATSLNTIQADWRYTLPNNPSQAAGPGVASHPILYVGGNSGVYRSLDNGQTWSIYPNITSDNAPIDGGYLPNDTVTSLTMSIGNVDPNTGRAVAQTGDPNVLLASTYGRGFFAIRLAPIVFPDSVELSTTNPPPSGSNGGPAPTGGPLVTIAQPFFTGVSEQTAFGNKARITLWDLTDPLNPEKIGGYDGTPGDNSDAAANWTDAYGNFSVQVNAGAFKANGVKTIGVQATDASGTVGNMATFSFTLDVQIIGTNQPPTPPTLALRGTDDSSHGQDITNVTRPHFDGKTDANTTVALVDAQGNPIPIIDPVSGQTVSSITSNPDGTFTLWVASPLAPGSYSLFAKATNSNGSSENNPAVNFTIKTSGPSTNNFQGLALADDSGIQGDNITDVRNPHFIGTTDPNALVDLINVANNQVLATLSADSGGNYAVQLPANLVNGKITLETRVHDVAGNNGPISPPITVSIISTLADYNNGGQTDPALFSRSGSQGTWLIKGVTPAGGTTFGPPSVVPFAGDFNGDGVTDFAFYNPAISTWTIEESLGKNLQSGNIQNIQLGSSGNIPIVGNFSGSGITEIGVFVPGQGSTPATWLIENNTQGLQSFQFGKAGDIPVSGDYDGTGTDVLAVYRPSTGQFLIDDTGNPANPTVITIGTPNLVPVPGDYDNIAYFGANPKQAEPRTEPAVFNPATGKMTILGPGGTSYGVTFQAGDIPVSGDYDGIGEAEPAVYRPSTGQFLVNNPLTKTTSVVWTSNVTGAVPVLAPYSYRQLGATVTTTPTISLNPADDSSHGKSITNVTKPHVVGKADPNALITLINATTNAVLGTGTADTNGNYSVAPTNALTDGTYTLEVRSQGTSGGAGLLSKTISVTIQGSLQVLSVTPADHSFQTALPNGQIVVTFNHPLVGLTADDPSGAGFSSNPFAVILVPDGPDGKTGAPSGIDDGVLPVHATLIYHVNVDSTGKPTTSTITLIPRVPLATNIYALGVSGVTDAANNQVMGNQGASPTPGSPYWISFELNNSPVSSTPLKVTGVTTLVTANGSSTNVVNASIPQPDTIGIAFNKPLDVLTVNTSAVQLIDRATLQPIQAGVTYSPTTDTVYLTPEATLTEGKVYLIRVDGSVSDDQSFPNPGTTPGTTLGSPYYTTFTVTSAGAGAGTSPFQVLKNSNGKLNTMPGDGMRWTQPMGYASIPFSEPVDMTSLGRYSVYLKEQAGGLNNTGFDAGDVPINAKLAFNPNLNEIIIVPTVPTGNDMYVYSISNMKATNGDSLTNPGGTVPVYGSFLLQTNTSISALSISQPSHSAASFAVTPSSSTPATPVANVTITSASTSTGGQSTPAAAPSPTRPVRPAQSNAARAHDHALGQSLNALSFARHRKVSATALETLAAERAHRHGLNG